MGSAFVAGEIVYLDDNPDVMFLIVHIKDALAWIEPYGHHGRHKHFKVSGRCGCSVNHLVDTSRLWRTVWSKIIHDIKEGQNVEQTQAVEVVAPRSQ